MKGYDIRGIAVDFPFDAYQCQRVYMEKVSECLQNVSRLTSFPLWRPRKTSRLLEDSLDGDKYIYGRQYRYFIMEYIYSILMMLLLVMIWM